MCLIIPHFGRGDWVTWLGYVVTSVTKVGWGTQSLLHWKLKNRFCSWLTEHYQTYNLHTTQHAYVTSPTNKPSIVMLCPWQTGDSTVPHDVRVMCRSRETCTDMGDRHVCQTSNLGINWVVMFAVAIHYLIYLFIIVFYRVRTWPVRVSERFTGLTSCIQRT